VSEQVPGQEDRDDTREGDADQLPQTRGDDQESDADQAVRRQAEQERSGQESPT